MLRVVVLQLREPIALAVLINWVVFNPNTGKIPGGATSRGCLFLFSGCAFDPDRAEPRA